jgi:hypothetical protein
LIGEAYAFECEGYFRQGTAALIHRAKDWEGDWFEPGDPGHIDRPGQTEPLNQEKVAQGTTWMQEWVKPLTDLITVNEHPSELFEWKICRGQPPALLDVLRMRAATFASSDVRFRRRALWTQLRNILDLHGVDTTQMGTAYPE